MDVKFLSNLKMRTWYILYAFPSCAFLKVLSVKLIFPCSLFAFSHRSITIYLLDMLLMCTTLSMTTTQRMCFRHLLE